MEGYAIVDAFSRRPFGGNPAAVIVLPADSEYPPDDRLLRVAAEFNLAETAYVIRDTAAAGSRIRYRLRWFTTAVEVELCGHATLASAHVLFKNHHPEADMIYFDTLSGTLTARRDEDGLIALDFPQRTIADRGDDHDFVQLVVKALKIPSVDSIVHIGTNPRFTLVEVLPSCNVEDLVIDLELAGRLGTFGLIVTSVSAPHHIASSPHRPHFVARTFFPGDAVPEDPVCGSAHCELAVHYASRDITEDPVLRSRFVSRRGGDIHVRLKEGGRMDLMGHACTVMEGKFCA